MRRSAPRTSALLALLLGAGLAVPAHAAEKLDPAQRQTESLIREAAELEKAENCEAAYLKYREAEEQVSAIADPKKAGELEAIIANKAEKLEECHHSCQPSPRQRAMLASARGFAEKGEVRRAAQITKRMLVGKNEKCQFWSGARSFLRTLPKQSEELDQEKVDPCEVTPDITEAVEEARNASRRHQQALAALEKDKKLGTKMAQLIDLYREIDATRLKVFELREEFLDCESVYRPLVDESEALRGAFGQAQELILVNYQGQLKSLSKKVRAFQTKLGERDKKIAEQQKSLEGQADELARLKKDFDDLSAFNEEIYDDLFNLASSESLSFTTQVEGRRIEQPAEEIRALMADQARVMKTLQARYPEYFQDGVNVEGLKRKRFVLEKMQQVMEKFGRQGAGNKLGYDRALAEMDATIKMMDKAIVASEPHAETRPAGIARDLPLWLAIPVGIGVALLVASLVMLLRRRQHPDGQ